MRRLIAPAALIAVLALAGCSAPSDAEPAPAGETVTAVAIEDAATVDEAVDWVLSQDADSMSADDVADAASKLNELAAQQYSNAIYGDIKADMNTLTLDAVDGEDGVQDRLVELTKQIRELG
jgi:hypothetical protein